MFFEPLGLNGVARTLLGRDFFSFVGWTGQETCETGTTSNVAVPTILRVISNADHDRPPRDDRRPDVQIDPEIA